MQKFKKIIGKTFMIIGIILVAVIVLALVFGSGDDEKNEEPETATQTETTEMKVETEPVTEATTEAKTYGIGDTYELLGENIKLLQVKEVPADEYIAPAEGNVIVAAEWEIENTGVTDKISSAFVISAYCNDTFLNTTASALSAMPGEILNAANLAPGKKCTGWSAWEVPADWTKIELIYNAGYTSLSDAKFIVNK